MRTSRTHRASLSVAALVIALAGGAPACAQDIVFADIVDPTLPDGASIKRISTSGADLQTLIPVGGGLRGVDVDPAAGFVYWTDVDNFAVRRARLNGADQQDIAAVGVAFPSAIRLNLGAGRVYWGDQTSEELRSADLDGGNPQTPLGTIPFFRGIAIDPAAGLVYYTESLTAQTGRIMKCGLDGSNPQVVIPVGGTFFKPGNVAVDPAGGKIYWTDAVARVARRANLDGSGMQTILDGAFIGPPKGIALDVGAGRVYIGVDVRDSETDFFISGQIHRMNLDGGEPLIIAEGLGSVNDLVLIPEGSPPCAADFNGQNGATVQDVYDFLADWSSQIAGGPVILASADFNGTDGVTVQDIYDFLTAWNDGCD